MTLHTLYNIFNGITTGAIVLTALFGVWYIICIAKDSDPKWSAVGMIASGMLIMAVMIPKIWIQTKLYPPGECPNCEQSITTRYCEDCGWENDSYYEITDRG